MLVGGKVIVECKAVREFHSVFEAQLLTWLRLTGHKLGLVINFGEKLVKNGVHRVVNGLPEYKKWHKKWGWFNNHFTLFANGGKYTPDIAQKG